MPLHIAHWGGKGGGGEGSGGVNTILADRAACRSSGQASHRAVSPSSRVAIMLAASASALSRTAHFHVGAAPNAVFRAS